MKTSWSVDELSRICGGRVFGNGNAVFSELAHDSRKLPGTAHVLFIALEGENHDGHRFIGELYELGVRSFLVRKAPDTDSTEGAGFCMVDDPLLSLHALAAGHRSAYTGTVAAITGSNGKTIVKEWIYQLMGGAFNVHRSPLSYNSQLGVPLSVWTMGEEHEYSLIEAGISRPGEMERLEKVIRPDIGLFTNLGPAHQENFRGLKEKLSEKLVLFRGCRKVIARAGLPAGRTGAMDHLRKLKAELVTWSTSGEADYRYEVQRRDGSGPGIILKKDEGDIPFTFPFHDEASLENGLHALTFALEAGLSLEEAQKKLAVLEPVSMRMEILRGINGSILVNDSYNADVAGLSAALDLLSQQQQLNRKAVILSDLLETGRREEELYPEIAQLLRRNDIGLFIGIGPALLRNRKLFPENSLFFEDTDEFLNRIDMTLLSGSSVLIKGSRKFGFERISKEFQLQTHQTRLEIDLNAMVGNLGYFRSLLKEDVRIMVMVKALSYGSGSVEIAGLLQFHKVDYLAVAFIDEGIELRKAGIHLPIMVMNPDPSGYGAMIDYRLEPEVFSFRGLEALRQLLEYREIRDYPVHLKIDTGMHRLGFNPEETEELAEAAIVPVFRIASVFSHLSASDEPEHDGFTRMQIQNFRQACDLLESRLKEKPLRHILNSAGIERFPDAQMDMVRLGIGLHGIGRGEGLVQAATFKTTISQVRSVAPGESVGYSRMGRTTGKTLVATLPVGYADGLDRRLGNGVGKVWINGMMAPVIGNVCMDMTMIDVTGLHVSEGDQVELFGKNLPVTVLADKTGTIPYEILTSVPERVKRIYLQE